MADNKPTAEQEAIIEASLSGDSIVTQAGAGCGKTTNLKQIAKAKPKYERIGLAAFNRSIAAEAKATFPSNTTCSTTHSFAFRAVGVRFKERLNGPRVSAKQTAHLLDIKEGV